MEEAVLDLEEGKAQEDVKPLQLQNVQSLLINMKNMCTMTTNTIISFQLDEIKLHIIHFFSSNSSLLQNFSFLQDDIAFHMN